MSQEEAVHNTVYNMDCVP